MPCTVANPDLRPIVQTYLNQGLKVKELSQTIAQEHKINISIRSLEHLISHLNLRTAHNPQVDKEAAGIAILQLTQEDLLGTWNACKLQGKICLCGIHLPR
jgi:hypothetical protein